jgi:predicted nucleic acid-binding protein
LIVCRIYAGHFHRARQVQRTLADKGLRERKVPDLLIAAVAASRRMTVLHYDSDHRQRHRPTRRVGRSQRRHRLTAQSWS